MFEAAVPQNNNDLNAEKGPACDIRHRFVLSAVYDVRSYNRWSWSRALTRNWQVSTIYQAQSGFPFTISVFGDTANTGTVLGENPVRANYTGQPVFGPGTHTAEQWFNPRAFSAPAPYTVRQPGPQYGVRAGHADAGFCGGTEFSAHGSGTAASSLGGFQWAEQGESGNSESVCEYGAVWHDYGIVDTRAADSAQRAAFVLVVAQLSSRCCLA